MSELDIIGIQIGACIQQIIEMVQQSGLTQEDLNKFEQYVNRQESIGAIFDPTAYREMLQTNGFEESKKRTALIRSALALQNFRPRQYKFGGE